MSSSDASEKKQDVTFLQAVKDRYGAEDETVYDANAFSVGTTKGGKKGKTWEMVGMEKTRAKQSQHSRLFSLVLAGCGINKVEDVDGEIKEAKLHNVRDLDLSDNTALNNFKDIHFISTNLPRLQSVQLNRIVFNPASLATPGPFNTVTRVILNYCKLGRFAALEELQVPRLEELHVEGCDFASLNTEGKNVQFPNCNIVNLSDNPFQSWGSQVEGDDRTFGSILTSVFPALKILKLNKTQLPPFETDENSSQDLQFLSELEGFAMSECPNWGTAASLQVLQKKSPKCTWLHVSSTSIFAPLGEVQSRLMVIATVPQLKTLNLGSVRQAELLDAESFYVQRAYGVVSDALEREVQYPRAKMLRERFGDSIKVGAEADGPIHVILPLTFRCLGFPDVQKSLPSSTTIEKLKQLVSTFIKGAQPSKQTLSFTTQDEVAMSAPIPLDQDTQTLAYYGVGSHAIIAVALPENE